MKTFYPLLIFGLVISTMVIAVEVAYNVFRYYESPKYYYKGLEELYANKARTPLMEEAFARTFIEETEESCASSVRLILILVAVLVVMWSVPIVLAIRKARGSLRKILMLAVMLLVMWSVPIVLAVRIAVLPARDVLPGLREHLAQVLS